jgi:hypothetical protein
MMKWFLSIAFICACAVAFYLFQYGGWRIKQGLTSFADHLSACSPLNQDFYDPLSHRTMNRQIEGLENETCNVVFETYSPQRLYCAFAVADLPDVADGYRALADNIGLMGGFTFAYDSNNPNPANAILSSPACQARDD